VPCAQSMSVCTVHVRVHRSMCTGPCAQSMSVCTGPCAQSMCTCPSRECVYMQLSSYVLQMLQSDATVLSVFTLRDALIAFI
jgi:hypothetical protein